MGQPVRKIFKEQWTSIPCQLYIFNLSTVTLAILLCFKGREVTTEQPSEDLLDENCLLCFCQAMSGCNHSIGCITDDKVYCGPYQLSYAYWEDGGKLGNRDLSTEYEDFMDCANSERCAAKTIQNYNRGFYGDCNGDGSQNCVDFFRTHLAGPNLCHENELETEIYWLKFLECYLNLANSTEDALHSIRSYKSK